MLRAGASDSEQRLGRLFDAVAQDIVDATHHYRLYCDLVDAVDEFKVEMNQSLAFWRLTLNAHVHSFHSCLFRAYDQHAKALSLHTLLKEVRRQPELFGSSPPTIADVEQDLDLVTSADPLVKRLVSYRCNLFAHRNTDNVVEELRREERFGLTCDDLDKLLDRAVTILNKYDHAFRRTTWRAKIVGHDDFRQVLKSLRETNERREEAFRAEFQQYGSPRVDTNAKGDT